MFKRLKKLEKDVEEIKDVLIREDGAHLGSEIDKKVEESDFESFKKEVREEIKKLRDEIFAKEPSEPAMFYWTASTLSPYLYTTTTQAKKIPLEQKLQAIEKFLGIEYKKEEQKFEGYKPIKKKK